MDIEISTPERWGLRTLVRTWHRNLIPVCLIIFCLSASGCGDTDEIASDAIHINPPITLERFMLELRHRAISPGTLTDKSFVDGTKRDMVKNFSSTDPLTVQDTIIDCITQNLTPGIWHPSLLDMNIYTKGEQINIYRSLYVIDEGFVYINVRQKRLEERALESLGEEVILEIIDFRIRVYYSSKKVEVEAVRLFPMRTEAEIDEGLEVLFRAMGIDQEINDPQTSD